MGRRKKHHEGHHGGAWKVAYADFVTAMMALFMVLWIVAQDEEILIATSKYFQSPFNSPLENSNGVVDGTDGLFSDMESSNETPSNVVENAFLMEMASEFYRLLNIDDSVQDSPVEVQVTSDGLRITVFDGSDQPLYEQGSGNFTEWGTFVMQNLSWLIERHDMKVRVDAHAARGEEAQGYQDLWELTTARANSARQAMEYFALDPAKVERVTGFADREPLRGSDPADARNQRLELSLSVFPGER